MWCAERMAMTKDGLVRLGFDDLAETYQPLHVKY